MIPHLFCVENLFSSYIFIFISDYFTLDSVSGQITLAKVLSGARRISLVANATDCMEPPHTTLIKVDIFVKEAYVEDIKHHGKLSNNQLKLTE